MGSISDISQPQWAAAFRRLGMTVDEALGNGSHIRVFGGNKNIPPMTIPIHTYKQLNLKIYKKLKLLGFTEAEIKKALKIK